MKLKHKALILNFIGFTILFLIARFCLGYLFTIDRLYLSIVAAIIATLLVPKFVVVKAADGEKLMMKWLFLKGFKEI